MSVAAPVVPNLAGFEEFPKIARLTRGCIVTEKIDGTNAQVHIATRNELSEELQRLARVVEIDGQAAYMLAGSRNRYITPLADNFGFARWVNDYAEELAQLGYGRHFGEWWGSGIQRGYGLLKGEKRFSLFNVGRWVPDDQPLMDKQLHPPPCCDVVPILWGGDFNTDAINEALDLLRREGSAAAPGFTNPEGIVVWHESARVLFKKTLDGDGHKGSR